MDEKECLSKLSPFLFWDIDMSQASMDACPQQVVQRVLEYGNLDDWRLIRAYYGLHRIVELCKQMRTLDPVFLIFASCPARQKKNIDVIIRYSRGPHSGTLVPDVVKNFQ